MAKNNGGPAFPGRRFSGRVYYNERTCSNEESEEPVPGMTLRDYFAAKAMQGELAAMCEVPGIALDAGDEFIAKLARHYYRIADAMLEARK